MIQIENWMIIAGIFFIFGLSTVYLVYVIVKSKLFPKTLDFHKEINPNEGVTISSIEGSGIIKKIEMSITENNQSIMNMIVDQTSLVEVCFDRTTIQDSKLNSLEKNLNVKINLSKKFEKNFTIFFQNRSENVVHLNGNIAYEIKKPLKTTLRTILSELH